MTTTTTKTTSTSTSTNARSGIRKLEPGEILFRENDLAESLYIIQKGQLRLFRPKGRGFVEIGVLRSGEVLGEMAFFDDKSKTRSASASAIVSTEVIEISFNALEKTMTNLNPWFRTLINTLVDRVKNGNERIKSLEGNSLSFGLSGKVAEYKFFQNADIIRLFSILYLSFKAMSEKKDSGHFILNSKIKFYAIDIFNISEVKYEEFIQLLTEENLIHSVDQGIVVKDPEIFKVLQTFYSTQRMLEEDKKINISAKCEKFLLKVLEQVKLKANAELVEVNLTEIVAHFKEYNLPIVLDDFGDALHAKFCSEYYVGKQGEILTKINAPYLIKMMPIVKFMNALSRINSSKQK